MPVTVLTLVAFHLRIKWRATSLADAPLIRIPTSCQGMRGTKPLSTESDNNERKQDKGSQLMIKTDVQITTKERQIGNRSLKDLVFRKEVAKRDFR